MRLCVMCKHFKIVEGGQDYSEYTPGWDARIGCDLYNYKDSGKGPWEMDNFDVDEKRFRAFIRRAETCSDYREAE